LQALLLVVVSCDLETVNADYNGGGNDLFVLKIDKYLYLGGFAQIEDKLKSQKENLLIYANLSNGILDLDFSGFEIGRYEMNVLDVDWCLIFSKSIRIDNRNLFKHSINLSSLSKGFLFYPD